MILQNGTVFCEDGTFRKMDVEIHGDQISRLHTQTTLPRTGDTLDCAGMYIVPGFFDLHIHGAVGADFSDGTAEAFGAMAGFLPRCGVTSFLGTSMALPEACLTAVYTAARGHIGVDIPTRAVLRGINMEGPFFSKKRRGAQNEKYIIPASYEMFSRLNEASGGNIRTVAVAPEVEEALPFIQQASAHCAVSLAHSAGGYDIAQQAFSLGASHVTHLFNGMEPFHHRDPGIVGAAADAGVYVEVISDGVHLHPSTVRAIFKLFGDDKVCLISDAMRACGMADGQYDLGGQLVTVKDGAATVEGGSLAGSTTSLYDCFRRAVSFGVPLESALKAATHNPAKSVSLDGEIGSIAPGKRADLLVMDRNLLLQSVVLGGVLQPPSKTLSH